MKTKSKTVRDANKVAKLFVSQVEARAYQLKCNHAFVIGYLESFLAMHADKKLLDTMESYITHLREKDAA